MSQSEDPKYIAELAKKLQENNFTQEEFQTFEDWYNEVDNVLEIGTDESREEMESRIYHEILVKAEIRSKPVRRIWYGVAAASLLFFITFGIYFLLYKNEHFQDVALHTEAILSGSNKAILTLSDGKELVLEGENQDYLTLADGKSVISKSDGKLRYDIQAHGKVDANASLYNSVTTPLGGQYQLVLGDGTKVWLNSGSRIKFPTAFSPAQRLVEVEGEAYFEVSHHAKWPFKVISKKQTIEVYGTHFNVNAYGNENQMITTLFEGSVRVSTAYGSKMLTPGQQAVVDGGNLSVAHADTEEAIAWKEGYFRFNNENIEPVMRKLARWYNVEVIFEGKISQEAFNGKISRSKNLDQALKMLEKTGAIHFKIEGRRVIVTQ
jgi:ferric-dicitrate binding protein FerR (iron transport regulator)